MSRSDMPGGPRHRPYRWLVAALPLLLACDARSQPLPEQEGPLPVAAASAVELAGTPTVFVGAGDIAACDKKGDSETAALLDRIVAEHPDAVVFTTGDNAYPDGAESRFRRCYEPTWGRHKARTRPSPGNHDYRTEGARGYYEYFGAAAGERGKGYYSYEVGPWHVISLNSEIDTDHGDPQLRWLEADLAESSAECTLAYWHQPYYSSGATHGNDNDYAAFWEVLHAHGAEIVLAGHDHVYERFAPQNPYAKADPEYGIRQFTTGLGGKSRYDFDPPEPNSEVRYSEDYGVLKLSLYDGGYAWEFIAVDGSIVDSGSGTCHGAPGSGATTSGESGASG